MQLSFSASGTKVHVAQELVKQFRQLRTNEPNSAALVMAVRDELTRHVEAAGVDQLISLSASVSVAVTVKDAPKDAPKESAKPAAATTEAAAKP